jgi:hypothetical protein
MRSVWHARKDEKHTDSTAHLGSIMAFPIRPESTLSRSRKPILTPVKERNLFGIIEVQSLGHDLRLRVGNGGLLDHRMISDFASFNAPNARGARHHGTVPSERLRG